ncbi:MAG: DUF255 domain-containing protein [Acidobacteria bacterium]|nr:MAG: DUF255 domain-containing protein [Acidobacteriota bacterium]
MIRRLLAGAALVAALGPASGAVRWFPGDLDAAREEARLRGKLVLVDCWARWCRFCHVMDDEVWSDPDLAMDLEREVVPVRIEVDVPHGRGVDLAQRYGIEGLPVILFLDPDEGAVRARLEGMQHGPAILAALDEALGPAPESAPEGAGPERLVRLAARWIRAGRRAKAERALGKVLAIDSACRSDAADDAALLLARLRPERAAELYARTAPTCRGADRERLLWDRWTLALSPDGEELGAQLRAKAERFPRDGEAALELAAWLRGEGRLREAAGEARRAAELLPGDTRAFALLAEILEAEGDREGALAALEEAIAIDPHDPELRKARLRLRLERRGERR